MEIGTKYVKIMTQFITKEVEEEGIEFKEIEYVKKKTDDR